MAALIVGERDPAVLAEPARGSLRSKAARLNEALSGRFSEQHAFLLTQMLGAARSPQLILVETGTDMGGFPTPHAWPLGASRSWGRMPWQR
jgi:hypothetical protein